MSTRRRPPRSARNKMMDLLARRDHSEKEIRTKLKEREFSQDEIETAIRYGRENKWLPDTPDENLKLAQRMATGLHRKNKGIQYINHFLKQKGLPPISLEQDVELEKAQQLIENKFSGKLPVTREERAKRKAHIGRFLLSRGFTMDTIRKVIK